MKQLLLGTLNQGKIYELSYVLREQFGNSIEILTPKDLKIKKEPEETGKTFEENALLKARFYSNLTDLPTIADDGGICIEALGGAPGVKSRRWLGSNPSDDKLIAYTLKRLENIPPSKRSAYIEVCLCFYDPKTKESIFEKERVYGKLSDKVSRKALAGYPYRALFVVNKYGKYYDELTSFLLSSSKVTPSISTS